MGNPIPPTAESIQQKYNEERDKRIRPDGDAQFITIPSFSAPDENNKRLARFAADPWDAELAEAQKKYGARSTLPPHAKIMIIGAGYGGLYFAVRLLQAGFSVDDLLIVDSAGGFGGTWYWNRYPGLMCDVESYIYMPLLEELGYMPKHKYAGGNELRNHANAIAEKWGLYPAAMFKTLVKGMKWDEEKKSWEVDAMQLRDGTDDPNNVSGTVSADFVILATGLLNMPKMPDVPGIEKFQGHSFHTSRWDYEYTGGSPEDPSLTNLKDKKVGIVGTGATAIQAVPKLAKWAKELYVFQRTPSAVDVRDNRETDAEWWTSEVASKTGWQKERRENYNAFISNVTPAPPSNMVDDGWTKMQSYCVLVGGPNNFHPDFVSLIHELDLPRQESVRSRVDNIIKDETTAESLKAWYPGWCKRPCFHDEYLPSFNEPHVHLVDTDGRGIEGLTENGIIIGKDSNNTTEYNDFDLIIFSTGFRLPATNSPAARGSFSVTGRSGLDMEHKWTVQGVKTLHGVVSHDFPNLFYPGPSQAGAGPNHGYTLDIMATHIAYIISETVKRGNAATGGKNGRVSVEPSAEAEKAWTMRIIELVGGLAAVAGCTPSYLNGEAGLGSSDSSMESMLKVAGLGNWGLGIADYVKVMEAWREKGDMEGLVVNSS
ncbi:hypothetical protein FQN54_005290 [Arachnomyces sp. PD_36]|nr:hypothetical protein FQN54_005290 [Arachnomyces sp. PD_36]